MNYFDIVAFNVPDHHSLIYRKYQTKEQLLTLVAKSVDLGANVISIRGVREGWEGKDEPFCEKGSRKTKE